MAFSSFVSSLSLLQSTPDSGFTFLKRSRFNTHTTKFSALSIKSSSSSANESEESSSNSTKLITFLGKGGSGKTTSAIFAAQHYAMAGLSTCLVIQTQDPTADYLLDCKIGTSPIKCKDNLSAVRLETTRLLLEPLDRLKKADAHLKMTQGVLEGIVGEELGVLPAMDSIFAALELERLLGLIRKVKRKNYKLDKLDIVIYDGVSSDEILRLVGAASKARLYLKYLRTLAEKTDLGRLAGPSLLRLVDESMNLTGSGSYLNGKMSADIWDTLEQMLEKGITAFSDPQKFGCFLVVNPTSPASVNAALRYWGCTIQAGAQVSGAIGISSPSLNAETLQDVKRKFSPLPMACIPPASGNYPIEWDSIIRDSTSQNARALFSSAATPSNNITSPVIFDAANKSVTLFMPGFDKSEIKLFQYRGGAELLVEAGDQRRVIRLPQNIQGKVGGAKFSNRTLVITMR